MIAGIGVPQITAVLEVKKSLKNKKLKIISDGGIKFSGDIVKGLAAGADAIMMGSIFAGTDESQVKNLNIKINFINLTEAWDRLALCQQDHPIDIFKKIIKISLNLYQRE